MNIEVLFYSSTSSFVIHHSVFDILSGRCVGRSAVVLVISACRFVKPLPAPPGGGNRTRAITFTSPATLKMGARQHNHNPFY